MPQSGGFIIQLPRRVLGVYWLGYLAGSVSLEPVSGASSLLSTGLYVDGQFIDTQETHVQSQVYFQHPSENHSRNLVPLCHTIKCQTKTKRDRLAHVFLP